MADRLTVVRRALLDAPADRLVECLAESIAKEYAVTGLELLLVDYRLAALVPLLAGPDRKSVV